MKKADLYSSDIKLAYDNGSKSLKTWFGVIVGLIITSVLIFYAQIKLNVLLDYQDITIMEPLIRNYFNDTYQFNTGMGLQVAFGLVGYDSSSDPSKGDAYGEVKIYQRIWGDIDKVTGDPIPTFLREI